MTNEEAIKSALNKVKKQKENFGFMDRFNVDENWEVMQALEKQIPKKPKAIDWERFKDKVDNAEFMRGGFWCPNCGHFIKSGSYCCDCGQALDWGEGESE